MSEPLHGGTGKPPVAHPCPRCGKRVGMFFFGLKWELARHKKPRGGWCRPPIREAGSGKILTQP